VVESISGIVSPVNSFSRISEPAQGSPMPDVYAFAPPPGRGRAGTLAAVHSAIDDCDRGVAAGLPGRGSSP
jgi:hypothetical protein